MTGWKDSQLFAHATFWGVTMREGHHRRNVGTLVWLRWFYSKNNDVMNTVIFKQANKNLILNGNQLTFLDTRFYLTDNGVFVPSVTTYLEAYPKSFAYYEWLKSAGENADEIRDEAGRKGSTVHKLTERYDNGEEVTLLDENGFIDYKLSEWSMFEKYVEFRTKHKTAIIHNELNVVSEAYKMGGTIDRVMQINGKLYLVDIKTSNAVHNHYWLQLAAYKTLLLEKQPELKLDGVAILWLNAKTRTDGKAGAVQGRGWQLVVCEEEMEMVKYWNRFKACQTLWMAENEEAKPRQLSYLITHKY
jgi:hypothetical protein